jgi:hypothetical protein
MGNTTKKQSIVDMGVEVYEDYQTKIKYKQKFNEKYPDNMICHKFA